jgi:hypothetical protein
MFPTAMQTVLDGHDTDVRLALGVPGVDSTDHVLPFQLSASGLELALTTERPPTAVQAVPATHETPLNTLPPDGGPGGVC